MFSIRWIPHDDGQLHQLLALQSHYSGRIKEDYMRGSYQISLKNKAIEKENCYAPDLHMVCCLFNGICFHFHLCKLDHWNSPDARKGGQH